MARLFSKRQGGWVDIPEEQVQEAYMSGLYAFPSNTEVNIQLPDGRYGTISSEHLQDAFRAGATYDQADVRQERIESAEYDERNLEAGGLAVARGLSFGLSDVLLDRLDLYSEEELAKLEKYNPNISLAGELTGAVAPALASGGTSLLAQGLSKGTVAGLSAKAGIAAEKAIAKRLGAGESVAGFELAKTADKMIQGDAALTGAATVEGALFGAVDGFSEQMLGRADRTAEQMLSHVGGIMALSGGLGGVLGLASPLIGKGLSAVNQSKYGKAVAEKAKDWESSILSAMHGGDKETYRKLLNSEYAHKVIFGHGKIAEETADQVALFIDDAIDGLELATRSVSGSEKKRLMRDVVESEDPLGAIDESIAMLHAALRKVKSAKKDKLVADGGELTALNKIEKGLEKQIDQIASMVAKNAAEGDVAIAVYGPQLRAAFAKDVELPNFSFKDTYKTSDLLSQNMVDGVLPELFITLDSFKRGIGKVIYKRSGSGVDNIMESGNPLVDVYHSLKNTLEDGSLFGTKAATRQRETNRAFTQLLPSYHRFLKKFTGEGEREGLGMASRAATEGEATVMATAESKALDDQIDILVDFRKRLRASRTYDADELEGAFQQLDASLLAAKNHANTLDDGIESVVDYRKKLEVLDKKAGSLRGNLGRMKQAASPGAAKKSKEIELIESKLLDAEESLKKYQGYYDNWNWPEGTTSQEVAEKLDELTETIKNLKSQKDVLQEPVKDKFFPDAARTAKMEAIRKELNEVVEESIELTNARPGLGLDEAANRETFRKAVADHEEMGRAFKKEVDKARKAVEKAKKSKITDPEAETLNELNKKLEDLIDRSVKHDRTPPLEKDYKVTRDFGEEQRKGRVAKWSGIRSFLKDAYRPEQSDSFRVFQEFVNNYDGFLKTIEKEYGKNTLLSASKTQTVDSLSKSYKALKTKTDELGDVQRAYREIYSVHSPMNTMLAALPLGGLMAGGPLGYLASGATSALVTPAAGFKRRAAIHGVKSLVASNLNKRATQVVNRIVKNTKPGAPQKARALPVLLALLGVKATGNPRDDARAAMNQMGQLADPDFLHSRLESSTRELAEAPKLREELFLGVAKHAGILADAASTDGAMNYDPITGQNEITRSDADVSKFMSIAEIGIGGTNVVADKMIAGTLTKAEGNAYREFYPIESQELIETIQVKLSNQGKRISWDDRALLTNLSGIAMTNTLTPMFIGAMQSVHEAATKNASGRKGGNTLRKTGEASTTLVEQAMYG